MIFQGKINRALKKLHEESDHPEVDHFDKKRKPDFSEDPDKPDLEKGDLPAMLIAALITFIPAAILVLVGISLIGYFFLMH